MLFSSRKSFLGRIGIAIAVLLVLGLATEALAARKARATGFYRAGRGQVNLPMQFVISASGNTGMHSIPLGFPNGDGMIDDDVSLIGKSPASLVLPQFALDGSYSALLALMGTNNVQITSMFTMFQGPQAPGGALFNPANGPGSFTFCPGATAGVPATMCNPLTSAGMNLPPQGAGTRNGRIVYTGGNGFGGVSQMLFGGGGLVSRPSVGFGFGSPIFRANHEVFGGQGAGMTPQAIGGPYGYVDLNMLNGASYTQPKTAPTSNGTIPSAGPFVTSMNALTSCPATSMGGAYPNIPLTGTAACVTGMGPLLMGSSGTTTNTGFPFTTGTVFAQQSTNTAAGADYFTVTGSDARTGRGIGNITLVAGGLALRTNAANPTGASGGSVDTISLTISEKTPSMSGIGFAAAAVLMVLAAGYAMRRRL